MKLLDIKNKGKWKIIKFLDYISCDDRRKILNYEVAYWADDIYPPMYCEYFEDKDQAEEYLNFRKKQYFVHQLNC